MQGFNDQEIVALSGAHTLGRAFHNRSGLGASLQALFADWTGCSSFQSRLACMAASALTACGLGSAVSGQQGTQVNALRAAFRWTPPRPLLTFSTQSTPHNSLTLDPAAVPARRQGDDEVHGAVPRRREDHRRLLLDHQLAQVRQRVRFSFCLVALEMLPCLWLGSWIAALLLRGGRNWHRSAPACSGAWLLSAARSRILAELPASRSVLII